MRFEAKTQQGVDEIRHVMESWLESQGVRVEAASHG
jgi:hypothetical protein